MKIIKIEKNNQVNGDGLRTVIWCAGCNHHCPKCHNPETWNPDYGTEFGQWVYDELSEQLNKPEISGVTFSGGEATYPTNRQCCTEIMKWIKKNYPNKTIRAYTGYLFDEIKDLEMMKYIDVLIDGPYIDEKNPGTGKLYWRGSDNQRVIDVPKSLIENKIVWYVTPFGVKINETEH